MHQACAVGPCFADLGVVICVLLLLLLQTACDNWQEGVESLRKDMAAGQNPSPDRVRDLLLSAAATGAALGHMDDLQVGGQRWGGRSDYETRVRCKACGCCVDCDVAGAAFGHMDDLQVRLLLLLL